MIPVPQVLGNRQTLKGTVSMKIYSHDFQNCVSYHIQFCIKEVYILEVHMFIKHIEVRFSGI